MKKRSEREGRTQGPLTEQGRRHRCRGQARRRGEDLSRHRGPGTERQLHVPHSIISVAGSGTSSWWRWPAPRVTPILMSGQRESRRAGSLLPPVLGRKASNVALAVRERCHAVPRHGRRSTAARCAEALVSTIRRRRSASSVVRDIDPDVRPPGGVVRPLKPRGYFGPGDRPHEIQTLLAGSSGSYLMVCDSSSPGITFTSLLVPTCSRPSRSTYR